MSAHSGLPALAVPAGFTPDDVPVGMDLIGEAFTEQDLLSLGLGIEKLLNLRRPPFSTPALSNGRMRLASSAEPAWMVGTFSSLNSIISRSSSM